MKKLLSKLFLFSIIAVLVSCTSYKVSYEDIKAKIYSNDFRFVVKDYLNRTTYTAPAGSGRITSSTINVGTDELMGVDVNHDRLVINLPLDGKESKINKNSVKALSEDFTVARSVLPNGNILLNFFLNDVRDINLIKMEIEKSGRIDGSIEGPKQPPLLYTGTLEMRK